MELFAKAHADEVVGLVLVDSRHRDFLEICEAAKLDWCGLPEPLLQQQATAAIASCVSSFALRRSSGSRPSEARLLVYSTVK